GAFEKRSQFCDLFDCSVVRCDVAEKEGFLFCGKAGSQLFCATGTKFTTVRFESLPINSAKAKTA
ncbi:MAG: hypothetical protein IK057_06010, partial [Clostridia bacterium]|nr:hypothetical protein [Clostridia bacterium]